jgi:FdrA protein
MIVRGLIKKGEYYDSVALMRIRQEMTGIDSITDCAAVMGTEQNIALLNDSGLYLPEFKGVGDMDLVLVVKGDKELNVSLALEQIEQFLGEMKKAKTQSSSHNPASLDGAISALPDANLISISVAGKYAGDLAKKALEKNLNVFLFSDNVPVENEIELKRFAVSKGLLLMGPDCGTAIINGIPLGFANSVSRGDIGIVAASGTGLQEVSCIISNEGAGVSQAIGVGSRDLSHDIGGIMFIEGIKALKNDDKTKIILLISKPPHKEILEKVIGLLRGIGKPIVGLFLGMDNPQINLPEMHLTSTLDEAAYFSVSLSKNLEKPTYNQMQIRRNSELKALADEIRNKLKAEQKYLRALYSGGTFVSEAQVVLSDSLKPIYSNAPTKISRLLDNPNHSRANTILDLGADEFTVGRPHPMIDYSLRNERMIGEASDPETAILLLDIVLGYGANLNPLDDIIPAIAKVVEISKKKGSVLPIICSVTGTDKDPQNRTKVVKGLTDMGVIVLESNAAACRLTSFILKGLEAKS